MKNFAKDVINNFESVAQDHIDNNNFVNINLKCDENALTIRIINNSISTS